MSGGHYEMFGTVAFGVSKPGGGCKGCVGAKIAWIPRCCKQRGGFWSTPCMPPQEAHLPGVRGSRIAPSRPPWEG